ncbi:MAG: penicillin acylase family protein [Candidatus Binatia bacterium]
MRTVRLPGDDRLEVVRDAHGVRHVRARAEADLYRGLGWCHARDRGLQMLLVRLFGQGRASEVLDGSDDLLRLDLFFRRLDPGAGADAAIAALAPDVRRLVEAYADGVNQALRRRTPWELRLVGWRPEPWTAADCVLVARVSGFVSLAQSQGDMERLVVELVQAGVPRPHLEELFPGLLDDVDFALLRRVRLGERLVPPAVRWNAALPRMIASNNWVVAPRKTGSGHALLANDPHLEANRLPAVWCEVVLELGPRWCIGATMPGFPATLLGRTNDLAWGATYTFMDATDSWIEDCRDGCHRRVGPTGDSWLPFRVRREVVRRKRKPPVEVVFYENGHGVLDGDPHEPGLRLATRWAPSTSGTASLAAVFALLRAPDVATGMQVVGRVETAWNWVLADRQGNIGYQMSGLLPRRRPGWSGVVPQPGWDPANDWAGFVDPEELPRAYNPPEGFLATANHDLNHLGRVRAITLPMGPYRAERIAALLAARDDWDVAATQAMHLDVLSPHAERFMAVLRPLLPDTPEGRLLRDWDCRYDLDSRGAVVFERVYRALVVAVFGRVCGTDVLQFVAGETGVLTDFYLVFDRVLLAPTSAWFGDEGRDALFGRVAAGALAGPAVTWGETQQLEMRHLLLGGRLPRWLGLDHGPVPLRGGRATIHQGQLYRAGGRATSFAPSYRLVTDLGEAAAHTALAGGPSDRPFSRWYRSGIDDWVAGRSKRLAPSGG